MTNPIEFFKKQVEIWNGNQHCGNCWEFGSPLSESGFEEQQLREESKCCYQFIITDYRTTTRSEFNSSNYPTRKICEHRFTFYVVKASSIDINTYNEIDNHPISESKYETIIKPLYDCLSCDAVLDYCQILGYPVQGIQWDVAPVINKTSNNYDGIKVTGMFREIM